MHHLILSSLLAIFLGKMIIISMDAWMDPKVKFKGSYEKLLRHKLVDCSAF